MQKNILLTWKTVIPAPDISKQFFIPKALARGGAMPAEKSNTNPMIIVEKVDENLAPVSSKIDCP